MIVEVAASGGRLSMLMVDESRNKVSNQPAERAVLISYGAPSAPQVLGVEVDLFLEESAKRLSSAANALVAVLLPSGVGASEGTFSPLRWKQDIAEAVEYLVSDVGVGVVYLVGYELISVQVLAVAAESASVAGVATVSTVPSVPPYGLSVYELCDQIENLGVRVPSSIETIRSWQNEYLAIDPVRIASQLGKTPWIVLHGMDDGAVPEAVLRELLEEVAGFGELHMITAGGESLRADPRVLALVVGWLARLVA